MCVAKIGPTFVALHPTVPLRLVYENHFCFTVFDAIGLPRDDLHSMEERLMDLTPHFYQASIRSFKYRLERALTTLISRSNARYKLYHDPSKPLRRQYLRYWTHDEQASTDYLIPRRTKSDRVQPLSSTIEFSLNMFTHWQSLRNNEMELQVCRPR